MGKALPSILVTCLNIFTFFPFFVKHFYLSWGGGGGLDFSSIHPPPALAYI